MGQFTGSSDVLLKGRKAHLQEEIVYTHNEYTITIPNGFVFDGATIPPAAWSLVGHPFMVLYRRPAAMHDWLCIHQTIPSPMVHKLFHQALLDEGVSKLRARMMYTAVKYFGPKF